MSLRAMRASLALWRRRHRYRQRRLDLAHKANDKARIAKWYALLAEAGRNIRRRQAQIAARRGAAPVTGKRARIVALGKQAAADYARRPWAWHYLAGGRPSLICLVPSPPGNRSDCSQWGVNIDREAGVPCPGSGTYLFSNTISIANGKFLSGPKVGAYGMWGPRHAPHHTERCVSVSPLRFIGHGTRAVDSITPGLPNFYIDCEA